MAYTPALFQHVFVPNSCNNDGDDDDDDENGSVMIMKWFCNDYEMVL